MASTFSLNRFKAGLREGRKQAGFWLTLGSPAAAEIASEAGFDWLLIDMEHAANEVQDVAHQMRAAHRGGAEPMVRVPELNSAIVKRLLDAGVRSFMFPNIQSVDEARRAVAATRYPPDGVRGVAGTTRGAYYGRDPEYFAKAHEQICIVLQLETAAALDLIAPIAALEGVDALFIGPSDLAADMGHIGKPGTETVQNAIAKGLTSIRATGKAAGTLNFNVDAARKQFDEGFDFIAVGGDGSLLARQTADLARTFGAN